MANSKKEPEPRKKISVVAEECIVQTTDIPDKPGEVELEEEPNWVLNIKVDEEPYIYALFVSPGLFKKLQNRFTAAGMTRISVSLPRGGEELLKGHPEDTWSEMPDGSSEKVLISKRVEFSGDVSQENL